MSWVWIGLNASFLPEARDEAEQALHRALELDPTLATVHRNLANLYQMQGRAAEAVRELELYLEFPVAKDREEIERRLKTMRESGPPANPGNR